MTETKFNKVFEFKREELSSVKLEGLQLKKFNETLMKDLEQKILRKFIECCEWGIDNCREVKRN